ncbi:MAG: AMP-dependent synthetase and ligase [Sphingomonas bacterium]|uniref:AMP-binding protein n=1 Tax=Sphingomonas bacterium TaxID=1895847 RepID=UPI002613FD70|nr:AMP-binding protein [Sphingomonas bacterium]MDB5694601.1 AMP-dependent synthetase and ligase [Sphingomonas bacterium]
MNRWRDPRMPTPEQCVLGDQLEFRARQTPDKLFALFETGERWTYAETLDLVRRTGEGLRRLGVKQGDYVNVWLPAGPDAVRVWFAINWIGAIYVPINLAYRGRLLEHVIANARARLILVDAELLPRLAEIDRAALSDAVVFGDAAAEIPALALRDSALLLADTGAPKADVEVWDTRMVIYTSGTTGPSKGVLISSAQAFSSTEYGWSWIGEDDRFLIASPLFHISGAGMIGIALSVGGSFALASRFSPSTFWDIVRETQSTSMVLMGVMATFLMKQPSRPEDRDHTLRSVLLSPLAEDGQAFADRFGVDVFTVFNMTEISTPLVSERNPQVIGSCGKLRPGVEARLVDANDCEVAPGALGELILRTDRTWGMNSGYLNDPEATARAWRNGWFHTGDAFRVDADGNYFFVDRVKDSIRRRGENISSFEVEGEVCAHPAVREAAAVAVPSEYGEDEVLVAVSLNSGMALDPRDLVRFLARRMAHFMVPRYVRVLDELPHTPTQKVEKHVLRAAGTAPGTFDREQAGMAFRGGNLVEEASPA